MRSEIMEYIHSNNELKQFLREQPIWYRTLCRHPEELQRFEITSMHYFKRTIPHRMEKFTNGVQMASMMMNMVQAMYSQG